MVRISEGDDIDSKEEGKDLLEKAFKDIYGLHYSTYFLPTTTPLIQLSQITLGNTGMKSSRSETKIL